MPSVELSDQQVVDLVKQLAPARRIEVLLALADQGRPKLEGRMERAENELRRIAAERKLDWDNMSESDRESLVDDLVHEDRKCT
jgi:hypothetical protein